MFGFCYLDSGRTAIWVLLSWSLECLGRSRGDLGGLLGALGVVLEASWRVLEASWTLLGRSWRPLGRSWVCLGGILGALGHVLGSLGTLLGMSWALLGCSWRHLGCNKSPKCRLMGVQDIPKSTRRGVAHSKHKSFKKHGFQFILMTVEVPGRVLGA